MKIFLISYDLSKPERDYESLINAIKSFDEPLQLQKSVWLIESNSNCNEIYFKLIRYIDKNDSLFICPLDLGDVNCNSTDTDIKNWFVEHNFNLLSKQ